MYCNKIFFAVLTFIFVFNIIYGNLHFLMKTILAKYDEEK